MGTLLDNLQVDYPRDIRSNTEFRIKLISECQENAVLCADVKRMCAANIIFWIDVFCWTKDPRKDPDVLPWICYDAYQPETILDLDSSIENQEDCLMDKSRDMGASWIALYVIQHRWQFRPGQDFRIGSRKEEFVDKLGDMDTLFEKLRFNLGRQPMFLMPLGFDWRFHSGYMKLVNPELENSIVGESANEDFASGGRRTAVLLDEFAKWDNKIATAAWTATADVTKCRIPISTPKGSGNKFAMLAKGTTEKIKRISLHWTLHPEKAKDAYLIAKDGRKTIINQDDPRAVFNLWLKHRSDHAPKPLRGGVVRSPWYDKECERRKEEDIAQELDINYLKSGYPFFDLVSVDRQIAWKLLERTGPSQAIPLGYYVQGNLIQVDQLVEFREIRGGWIRIFEMPTKSGQYVVGGDVAEGLAKGDESFAVVRDKFTRNVVAACSGKYEPDDFALKLQKMGAFYNNALVAPENNNHGYSVCSDLRQMDCNLFYTTNRPLKGKERVTKAGWSTTPATRPQCLDQLEEDIRKQSAEIRDPIILTQMETFVRNENNGKPEADGDFLDDGILACAIAGAVIQLHPYQPDKKKRTVTQQVVKQHKPGQRFKFKRSSK